MVPNDLLLANLVFFNWIREALLLFNDISNDCVKPFGALRFLFIFVLGAGTGCCFFILGAGIGLHGGIRLSSKYLINSCTLLLGSCYCLLLGGEIGRFASSLTFKQDFRAHCL